MISFKAFVNSIHDAILYANDALMDKNTGLLNKYFEEKTIETEENEKTVQKKILEPVSVIMDYPVVDEDGNEKKTEVHVPLITLVPISTSQIEKVTLTADFDMEIVNDEILIDFSDKKKSEGAFRNGKISRGTIEITISPQDTSDGLKHLIEGYETLIKKQIP